MITIIFTILSALYDKGKRFTDHSSRFIFRAAVVGAISIIEAPTIIVGIWEPTLMQFCFNTALFYMFFDYVLNLLEGRRWNYVGYTAEIDKMWHRMGGWIAQLIFKIAFITIIIYIKCH